MTKKPRRVREHDTEITKRRQQGIGQKAIAEILGLPIWHVGDRISALRLGKRVPALEGYRDPPAGPMRDRLCLACRQIKAIEAKRFICEGFRLEREKVDTSVWLDRADRRHACR